MSLERNAPFILKYAMPCSLKQELRQVLGGRKVIDPLILVGGLISLLIAYTYGQSPLKRVAWETNNHFIVKMSHTMIQVMNSKIQLAS